MSKRSSSESTGRGATRLANTPAGEFEKSYPRDRWAAQVWREEWRKQNAFYDKVSSIVGRQAVKIEREEDEEGVHGNYARRLIGKLLDRINDEIATLTIR
jgi:hypothetical protein